MAPELKTLFDSTEQLKAGILAHIASKTDAARNTRRSPKEWSLIEVLHHITIVNAVSLENVLPVPDPFPRGGPRATPTKYSLKLEAGVGAMRLGIPVPAPTNMIPPEGDTPPFLELAETWGKQQDTLRAALELVPSERVKFPFQRNPMLGMLSAIQFMRLQEAHLIYHHKQVMRFTELKAS